jgi:glycosyltransferase involved in cell wall biosynthesis
MHEVTKVTMPAENWRWRMRGAAVGLGELVGEAYSNRPPPDVVMVSSLLDLALFRELTYRHWGRPPTVLYMHENQLGYPSQRGTDPAYPWINWTSLLAADEIWFNSQFHLDSLIAALPAFLARFPDGPHDTQLDSVVSRSLVMPPGVDLTGITPQRNSSQRPRLLWNHRWEHDKRPDRFADALRTLEDLDFEVILCGEEPLGGDDIREQVVALLEDRLVWLGFASRDQYLDLLSQSDIVVSAAEHEYFGISVVEAIAAGCCPVVPDRLSYPELLSDWSGDRVLYVGSDPAPMLRARLSDIEATRNLGQEIAGLMSRHDWEVAARRYDDAVDRLVSGA